MEEFFTDYTLSAIMLLSVHPEDLVVGRIFEFKGTVAGYSKATARFTIKVRCGQSANKSMISAEIVNVV
jgi:hypothetical protein